MAKTAGKKQFSECSIQDIRKNFEFQFKARNCLKKHEDDDMDYTLCESYNVEGKQCSSLVKTFQNPIFEISGAINQHQCWGFQVISIVVMWGFIFKLFVIAI